MPQAAFRGGAEEGGGRSKLTWNVKTFTWQVGNNFQTLQKNDFIMCQIVSGILFYSERGRRSAFLLGTRILWNISRSEGPCFQQLTLLFAVCATKASACGHTWIDFGLIQGFFRVGFRFI